jgi:V8-like Glu-specific endopeptidase
MERMMRAAERLAAPAGAAAVFLIVLFSAAPAAAADASPRWSARQADEFWTPARMRRAQPTVRGPRGTLGAARAGADMDVPPHRVPPVGPAHAAATSSSFEEVPDATAPGARENGAVFLLDNGRLARCSGTAVNAPSMSVVFTAGHCVRDPGPRGRWHNQRWVFVPGYRYGQRPFGAFPAKWLDATLRWQTQGSENVDVGVAVVRRNERGQLLSQAVGGTGIAWGLPPAQSFDVHGYPAAPPFDGETQRICSPALYLGHDPLSFLFSGPLSLAVGCDVTGGASGGGWTIAGNILNGVTDYGYPTNPNTDFGAYFGKEVARLYGRAKRLR